MNISTVNDIKNELQHASKEELINHCLRLVKYKKENKELLHYILFEEINKENYLYEVKQEIATWFEDVNTTSVFLAKKTIRKIIRLIQKQIKYTQDKNIEAQLLLCFCEHYVALPLAFNKHAVLINIYESQKQKILKAIAHLHEDAQYDFIQQIPALVLH